MKKNNAIALMSRVKEKANRFIIKELERHGIEGIVPSHGDILYLLFDAQRHTMKELAEKIHRSKPTITVLVDKLVDCGYVIKEKSAQDSRVTFVKITDKGLSLRPIFEGISDSLNSMVYKGLSEQESELFEKMLLFASQSLG